MRTDSEFMKDYNSTAKQASTSSQRIISTESSESSAESVNLEETYKMMFADKTRYTDKGFMIAPGFYLTGLDKLNFNQTVNEDKDCQEKPEVSCDQKDASDIEMRSGQHSDRDISQATITMDGLHNNSTADNLLHNTHSFDSQSMQMNPAAVFHPSNLSMTSQLGTSNIF